MIIKCFNEEVKTSNKDCKANEFVVCFLLHFLPVLFLQSKFILF